MVITRRSFWASQTFYKDWKLSKEVHDYLCQLQRSQGRNSNPQIFRQYLEKWWLLDLATLRHISLQIMACATIRVWKKSLSALLTDMNHTHTEKDVISGNTEGVGKWSGCYLLMADPCFISWAKNVNKSGNFMAPSSNGRWPGVKCPQNFLGGPKFVAIKKFIIGKSNDPEKGL